MLSLAWLNLASVAEGKEKTFLRHKIDATLRALVSTFKGTDAVTLLRFLAPFLRSLDEEVRSLVSTTISGLNTHPSTSPLLVPTFPRLP